MSKHTAGPWRAVHNAHYWEICSDDFQLGDVCASQYTDPGKEEANARLMAAAPELLAALELLVAAANPELTGWGEAVCAIEKATGETK